MNLGVFPDEGGYTNDPHDPGGPTNWGITIHDARAYWKTDATAEDVKAMPKSVADDIYQKHYADYIRYNSLPPGIDYSVLDYAINSGVVHAIKTLQQIVGVTPDGIIGPNTLSATFKMDQIQTINKIWDERLAYDRSLTHLWPIYGHGWTNRYITGKKLALSLNQKYSQKENNMTSTSTSTVLSEVESALQALDTALPTVLGIVGVFYPPAKAILPFLPLIQEVLQVLNTVASATGNVTDASNVVSDALKKITSDLPQNLTTSGAQPNPLNSPMSAS